MARPKKTDEEKEATRVAAVARKRESRRAARAAAAEGKPRPKPKAKAKSKTAKPVAVVAAPKPVAPVAAPVAVVAAPEPPKSLWDSMGPRERRDYLRAAIDDAGRSPIDVADELDVSVSVVARWYRDATGRPVPQPEVEARRDEAAIRELEQRKLAELERQRKIRQLSTSIGELPPVKNPGIKAICRYDLHTFLQWYFPASTGLGPFGGPQMELIDRFALACQYPSRFLSILSRGFVKTTISVHALLWAALYGHSLNGVFLAANDDLASESVSSIKRELLFNQRLADDFPEVCHPIRALDNKPQRCMSQSYHGHLTMPEWTGDTIVLPTIPGSAASGAIIQSKGLEAASRGLSYKRIDGHNVRPTLVVIDDAQTDKSAKSIPEIRKRSDIIRKGVSRLGGHGARCSIVLNGTPLQPNDLIEQLSDRTKHPGWSKIRCPMFPQMPTEDQLREHWLGPYAAILTGFSDDDIDSQVRAEREATEYYIEHRAAMDAGFEVAWPSIPLEPNEISAIQHGMNIAILEGWDVFMAECQLSPLKPIASAALQITEDVAYRTSGYSRYVVPLDAPHLVFGVDVHDEILYYTVAAVAGDFSGYVVDYGTWPEQGTSFFTHATVRRTLADMYPDETPERAIELGVEDLVHRLLGSRWSNPNGDAVDITGGCVDVGYRPTEVANALRRLLPASQVISMSRGIGIGPTRKPMTDYDVSPSKVFRAGPDKKMPRWIQPVSGRDGLLLRTDFDANHWKDITAARFVQSSIQARWQLFGGDGDNHAMMAAHLSCEAPTLVTVAGRSVNMWDYAESSRDNHYWDTTVMCVLAASISGATLPGQVTRTPKQRYSAAERQRQNRERRLGATG